MRYLVLTTLAALPAWAGAAAPEIGPSAGLAALSLLVGGFAIVRSRRRK